MMDILSHMLSLKNKDKEENTPDNIKDAHYSKSAIEPLEYMALAFTRDEFIGFLKGNILKYSLRAPYKNQEEDDRRKAKFYTELLKEVVPYPSASLIACLEIFKQKQSLRK